MVYIILICDKYAYKNQLTEAILTCSHSALFYGRIWVCVPKLCGMHGLIDLSDSHARDPSTNLREGRLILFLFDNVLHRISETVQRFPRGSAYLFTPVCLRPPISMWIPKEVQKLHRGGKKKNLSFAGPRYCRGMIPTTSTDLWGSWTLNFLLTKVKTMIRPTWTLEHIFIGLLM